MKKNFIDRTIEFISPRRGAERLKYRYLNSAVEKEIRKYEAASGGRRTSGWKAINTSAASEISSALNKLRDRNRHLERNNPYAKNAIRELATNTVGTGIMATPSKEGIGKNIEKRLRKAWNAWADSTKCDWDGHLNFYGIQMLAMRTVALSGECLIRKRFDKEVGLKLQVLEGDFIDTTKHELSFGDGGYIYYGIEFNSNGQVVAYWLYEEHPGDAFRTSTKSNRVSADEVVHIFEKERPGQFRGVPMGVASMLKVKDLDDYEDAELVRQKIAACFSIFITNADPIPGVDSISDELTEKVEPGIIQRLRTGETIEFASPPTTTGYESYTKNVLRAIAVGYGMDYVTLTGDLSMVNFSSGRMGWLKFQRYIVQLQWNMLVPMCCNKIWEWFIQIAAINGIVKPDTEYPVRWTPPRREMIDPSKEIEAMITAIRGGLMSWPEGLRELGYNPEDVLAEMIEAKKLFDEAGVQPECDPRFENMQKGKVEEKKKKEEKE